jgi:PAS domain S-box-containing protein
VLESAWRGSAIDSRIVSLLRVVGVTLSIFALLTLPYLVALIGPGGSQPLIDLNQYPLGKFTSQYPLYAYSLDSASLEFVRDMPAGQSFLRVRIYDQNKYDGFGIAPVSGAPDRNSRLRIVWRGRASVRSAQVTVREGSDIPGFEYGETFAAMAAFPPDVWTQCEIPLDSFRDISETRKGPGVDGVLNAATLKSISFTFPPSQAFELDLRSLSIVWQGYSWGALFLLPLTAGVGLLLALRPFTRVIPLESDALLSSSAITRAAFILIASSVLFLVYHSGGWILQGPLLLHLALLALVLVEELTGGGWSYHRLLRFRYLAVLAGGWLLGTQLPATNWLILSICAYLPALQYEDQILTLSVPLIGLAIYLIGSYPQLPSLEVGLIGVAVSLLFALVAREAVRHVRTSELTERRLRQSEASYQAIFNAVGEGMLVVEPKTGRILEVNQAGTALLARSPDDLRSVRLEEIIPSVSPDELKARTGQDAPVARETTIQRKDHGAFSAEVIVHPLSLGEERCALVVVRDTSRRKRLEEQLRESQKMEAVGQLAGGIAHDFNNLLTVINCQAELALENVGPQEPLHQGLMEIHTAGVRAADLVSQLLAYSRKQMLQPRPVDLRRVLTEMQETLTWMAGGAVQVKLESPGAVDPVLADQRQIEQVIVNLAENALDAMAKVGGELVISVRNRSLSETEAAAIGELSPGRYVELKVCDDGEGMDSRTLSHLFEPFFTTKEMGKGSGLGLSTVYGIVRQHGGGIQVDSAPGRGTTFCVLFPRFTPAKPA